MLLQTSFLSHSGLTPRPEFGVVWSLLQARTRNAQAQRVQCRRTRKLDPGREKVADDMREKVLDMRLRPNVDEGRRQKSDHADDERRKKSEAVASTDGPAVSARGSEASGDDCMGGSMALILSVSCSSISSSPSPAQGTMVSWQNP